MKYLNIYHACPWLWEAVGHRYREIDVVGSAFFLTGSAAVTVISYFRLAGIGDAATRNAANIAFASLFILADTLLELRAIYSRLWERFHKRPSWRYHAGVGLLMPGTTMFIIALSLDMDSRGAYAETVGYLIFTATLAFLVGSCFLAVDAFKQLEKPCLLAVRDLYGSGSVLFIIGSALFLVGGVCHTDIGKVYNSALPARNGQYKTESACSSSLVGHSFGVGGIIFVMGSALFLVYAVEETRAMYKGPDPRSVAHHGREVAHPAHHEDYHLDRTVCSSSDGHERTAPRRSNSSDRRSGANADEVRRMVEGTRGSAVSGYTDKEKPGVAANGSIDDRSVVACQATGRHSMADASAPRLLGTHRHHPAVTIV